LLFIAFVNDLPILGQNGGDGGRYFLFNSEIKQNGNIIGFEIFSETDTTIEFNVMIYKKKHGKIKVKNSFLLFF